MNLLNGCPTRGRDNLPWVAEDKIGNIKIVLISAGSPGVAHPIYKIYFALRLQQTLLYILYAIAEAVRSAARPSSARSYFGSRVFHRSFHPCQDSSD